MRLSAIPLVAAALVCSTSLALAAGEGARPKSGASTRIQAPKPKKFEPYDPDRQRAGSRPGFFDVGGGTEVRIGGRTRVEYQYTR